MTETQSYTGPLFIIGMPRSGTKLLRNLLNRHDRVAIPDTESELLPWLVQHLGEFSDLSREENFERFYERVSKAPYFIYKKEAGRCPSARQWLAACRRHDAAGLFEALIRLDVGASVDSGVIWGDKSPSYIRHIPLIASLYPHARFIHIVRDVRDYCLSINMAWGKDMLRAAQRWADDVGDASQALHSLPNPHLQVRYEDLLTDTESVMRQCCSLLDLDFDPVMLHLARPSENLGDARGQTRIVAENLGKFRQRMPEYTLRRIEEIAGEVLEAHGYALAIPGTPPRRLGKFEMRVAQMRDGWNLIRSARAERGGYWQALSFHFRYFMTTRKF
ncbi:MAG: sulfotransferase family protein [Thiobacillaceae bacterium]